MSRVGNSSIKLPQDTTCSFENNVLSVKGKLGTATLLINDMFTINQKESPSSGTLLSPGRGTQITLRDRNLEFS